MTLFYSKRKGHGVLAKLYEKQRKDEGGNFITFILFYKTKDVKDGGRGQETGDELWCFFHW